MTEDPMLSSLTFVLLEQDGERRFSQEDIAWADSCLSPSLSSLTFVPLEQDGERKLSQKDIAWADSCLSKDHDFSESGWDSFKEALLETLDAQSNYLSSYEIENPPEEDKMDIFSSEDTGNMHRAEVIENPPDEDKMEISFNENTGNMHKAEVKNGFGFVTSSEGAVKSQLEFQSVVKESLSNEDVDDFLNLDNNPADSASTSEGAERQTEDFWSTHKMEDVFLPTYDENLKVLGISHPEVDVVFQEFQLEQATDDIFKIWEFDIPPEEDVLTKQLNKVLAEVSSEPTPTVSDDFELMLGLQDKALDDLISGIGNLVLMP